MPAAAASRSALAKAAPAARESPRDCAREMSESAVAEKAEKRTAGAENRREAGPVAASSMTVPYMPMHTVSMRDMSGSARGRMMVGSANRSSRFAVGGLWGASGDTVAPAAASTKRRSDREDHCLRRLDALRRRGSHGARSLTLTGLHDRCVRAWCGELPSISLQ